MEQPSVPSPSVPQSSQRGGNIGKIIALFIIALVGGLGGGFGLSYVVYQPKIQNLLNTTTNLQNQVAKLNSTLEGLLNMGGIGTKNQVQVSGSVSQTQAGDIEFTSLNGTISTTALIFSYHYSVLLVGGQSYDVYIYLSGYSHWTYDYSLYVPLGVTTFTANF
jgi:hypothetical protein